MNLSNLRANAPMLIEYLEQNSYSVSMIQYTEKIISFLLGPNAENWTSYEDARNELREMYKDSAKPTRSNINSRLNMVIAFDLLGKLPDGNPVTEIIKKGTYYKLNNSYKSLVDTYAEYLKTKRLSESSVRCYTGNASSILLKLQSRKILSIEEATEQHIVEIFFNGGAFTSVDYRRIFRDFAAHCGLDETISRKLITWIPRMKKHKRIPQYLTSEEADIFRETLRDESNGLTFRDRAVGALLFYTALRSIDIAELLISDVDFENDIISIVQEKTDEPWEISLSAAVGNPIYDYIHMERGNNTDPHLFISKHRPFKGITRKTVSGLILNRIFDAACVRMETTDRRGSHIFRHHLTKAMLEHEISGTVIAEALGHSSTASTEAYLNSDFPHLKMCGLNIEKFPLKRGSLCYEI